MMKLGNLSKIVFSVLLVGTILLAALGYRAFQGNLQALNTSSQEPIDWSALQLEIELLKFQSEISDFVIGVPNASAKTVNNRFDILWSRIDVFQRGKVGERLSNYTGSRQLIGQLFQEMKDQETTIVSLKNGDKETGRALLGAFSRYADDIRLLARTVYLGELGIESETRQNVRQSAYLTGYASVAFCLLSIVALIYINRESLRFRSLAEHNLELADEAAEANAAKSKFLAMMSHELRTPMNGVLGTLSLVRQSGLAPPQERLLSRAERSGKQMTTMLSDILDFSALQDDRLNLETKMFETSELVEAIEELFGAVAQREGIQFDVSADETCPFRISGDFKRIRQSLTHLTAYIVETAGTKKVNIRLSHSEDKLAAAISFAYSSLGGTWKPDLILGNVERSSDQFASDALGPSVARALIKKMGGTIQLDTPSNEQIGIIVTVNAKAVEIKQLLIKLEISSSALRAVCMAALAQDNVLFLDDDDPSNAHVVLTDCTGESDEVHVAELTKKHSDALLLAVGEPLQPDLFDGHIKMPIDIGELRENVISRMVG